MPAKVLDSFAVEAYFRGEPSGVIVRELLHKAAQADRPLHMTEVNYAEVKYIILRKDGASAWDTAAKVLETECLIFIDNFRRYCPIKYRPLISSGVSALL